MTEFFGRPHGENPTVYPSAGRTELLRWFAARGFTSGAEVGVWKGGFSEAMCKALPGLHLRCVDAWGDDPTYHEAKQAASWVAIRAQAERRLQPYGCVIDGRLSLTAAQSVPDRSLDFVYIDGNHGREAVYVDLEAWAPKVRVGGVVAGHDYRDFPARPLIQVKPAVDAFVRDHGIRDWAVLTRERNPSFYWVVS
jgi:hypothetical protein